MSEAVNRKGGFDLEERTLRFSQDVRRFVRNLPKGVIHEEDGRQLIRSSGSIGANYLEANDSLGRKDFVMRIRIARKEAKETRYWLEMFESLDVRLKPERDRLSSEALELVKILSAILKKFVD